MTLGERLKTLRRELGLSQEAVGALGFVSAPGWVKIENGQRQASEKLIERVCRWLVDDKYMRGPAVAALRVELLTLKYLGSRSPFVRDMARALAESLANGEALLAPSTAPAKPKRGRPPGALTGGRKAVAR